MKATKFFEILGLKAYTADFPEEKEIIRYNISGHLSGYLNRKLFYYENVWDPSDILNKRSADGIFDELSRFFPLFGFKDEERPSNPLELRTYKLEHKEHEKALVFLEKNYKDAPLTSVVRVMLGKEDLENDLPKVKVVANTVIWKWYKKRGESWLKSAMELDLRIPYWDLDTGDFLKRLSTAISIKYPEIETREQLTAVQKILGNSPSTRGFAGRVKKLFKETNMSLYGDNKLNINNIATLDSNEEDDDVELEETA